MKNKKARPGKAQKTRQKSITLIPGPGKPAVQCSVTEAYGSLHGLLVANRDVDAIFILEQMRKQLRKEKPVFIELLRLRLGSKQLDKAEELSLEMLKRFPGDSDILTRVARYYQTVNEPEKAIHFLEKALLINPKNLVTQHLLGTTYQGVGDKENAIQCLDKVLKQEPGNAFAIFTKSMMVKSKASEQFRQQVAGLVGSTDLPEQDRILLNFALAWLYELTDTKTHFEYLDRANAMAAKTRPWNGKTEQFRLDNIKALYSKAGVEALSHRGDSDFKPVFIAALPRSGTTLLEQMLGAHSQAYCVGENAPFEHAVNRVLQQGNPVAQRVSQKAGVPLEYIENYPEAIRALADDYKQGSVVVNAAGKQIIDKAVVNHFFVGLILLTFPKARIIHLQRHPLDIIYSCYQQYFEVGHNFIFSLETAAKSYKLYVQTMTHWKKVFPEKIYTVKYESLVGEPESTLRPLLEFCELPWEDRCLNYRDSMGSINTASAGQVTQPLYKDSIAKWQKVESYLAAAKKELGEFLDY